MGSLEVFERNLARLRQGQRELASAVEAAGSEGVELVVGPRGAETLSCGGVLLASAYDPAGEGKRIAEEMAREPADLLIAVGFGLGHHIEAYREHNPCPVIVYEPSLARLRAALSIRPSLRLLGVPDVRFAADVDRLSSLIHALYTPGLRIKVFPHPASLRLFPDGVREAVEVISRAKRNVDVTAATRVSLTASWAEITVENAPELLRSPSFSRLFDAFEGVPAVIAAAGPSLNKQLPLLTRYSERLLVIAIGQSLRALRREGIDPDLVHVIESKNVSRQLTDSGDTSDLSLVVLPSVHPEVLKIPVRERFISYPGPNQMGQWISSVLGDTRWVLGGGTVAQSAVHLAAAAGANPILLIGQDLAFTGGQTYAVGSAYDVVGFRMSSEGRYVLTNDAEHVRMVGETPEGQDSAERELVWVEGWDGERVPTSVSYASFIEAYREIGNGLRRLGIHLVNCTEGGARIQGLEHMPFAEALEACPPHSVNVRETISAAHREASSVPPEAFRGPLRSARRSLDTVEREARAGLNRIASARTALRVARSGERKIEILRGIGRCERQLKRGLNAIPWLDAFVQPAIQQSLTRFGRSKAEAPTPAEAVEESRVLFRAVVDGIDRARELLDRFEVRVARTGDSDEEVAAPLASRRLDGWEGVTP